MPRVLNKRIHGVPDGAVYVGRPSKWGNPYGAGRDDANRDVAIEQYEWWLDRNPDLVEALPELRGKDLVCWCRPPEGFQGRVLCHAQILVARANGCAPEDVV